MCGPSLAERPERQAAVDRSSCSRLTSRRSPVRAGHRPSSRARLGSGTSTIASADNMSRNGAVEALWKRGAARRSRGGGLRAQDGVPPRPASPTPGVLRSTTFHPRRGSRSEIGLRLLARVGVETIHTRVAELARRARLARARRCPRPLGSPSEPTCSGLTPRASFGAAGELPAASSLTQSLRDADDGGQASAALPA